MKLKENKSENKLKKKASEKDINELDTDIQYLKVLGARVHNLKNIALALPRNKLTVITGLSGSGKSSLAFDTIFAEGQRRYLESFPSYARGFIGNIEKPDVDSITGLSPVIAIEQKTTNKNPRSTVGTVTEIYDFLRLLYARAGIAYSPVTQQPMVKFTEDQMIHQITTEWQNKKIAVLAPLVRGRKGHYRELFDKALKQGYLKIRVDGNIEDLKPKMQVERYKIHDIELVIDRLEVNSSSTERLKKSVALALKSGDGLLFILDYETNEIKQFSKHLMCPVSGISYEEPSPNNFSFNSPYGACPECKGLGATSMPSLDLIIPDDSLTINQGGIAPLGELKENFIFNELRKILKKYNCSLSDPIHKIKPEALNFILYGNEEGIITSDDTVPSSYDYEKFSGIFNMLKKSYEDATSENVRAWATDFMKINTCNTCQGTRLKKEMLQFKIDGKNIAEVTDWDLDDLIEWLKNIEERLTEKQRLIATELLKEIKERIHFLIDVGLEYLALNRPSRSLSGGESQRIRLATQIGSQLMGITYILDEPSIGLHQRDNHKLINSLKKLRDTGNTVIVVEHDKDIMLASDFIIDIGPGAGKHGGEIIAMGSPKEFLKLPGITAAYLNHKKTIEIPKLRRPTQHGFIHLKGASGNNLKNVAVSFPLGVLTVVTGVSGSGKSSLINDTLYPILKHHVYNSKNPALPYESIEGIKQIDKVIEIDQSPIGRTPRSNAVTYINVFNDIRSLFAELPESKIRGYKPGRYSFNVKGGRCETCQGGGMKVIEMNFLPDVLMECETCRGKRYNRATLDVRYKRKNISEILDMTVEEAVPFFEPIPSIYRKIKMLHEVGLGYITLGQSATTFSGGEAQRVKLSAELSKKDTGNTFYILDEPTTGLHFQDIDILLKVLQALVDKGNTVLIIEHNLDIIKVADYVIDIGPDGGQKGGQILFSGTPEMLAQSQIGYTSKYLAEELKM